MEYIQAFVSLDGSEMILGEEGCKEQSGKKHQGKKKDFNRFLEVKETMADRAGQMMVNFSCQLG